MKSYSTYEEAEAASNGSPIIRQKDKDGRDFFIVTESNKKKRMAANVIGAVAATALGGPAGLAMFGAGMAGFRGAQKRKMRKLAEQARENEK